jgi:hypothetical protein
MSPATTWPDGKRFAFTVFDDTDSATVENVGPVYAFLADCGLRTTKSCWALRGDPQRGKFPGQTLDDDAYRQWLLALQEQGFEIGWHGATWHGSPHDRTAEALQRFREVFGHDPKAAANHTGMEDGIYWGSARLGGWRRSLYNLLTRYRNHGAYRGHVEGDEYFWGDLCRTKIKYVRNFAFRDINTLKACPWMPYYDPQRPFVSGWFASSDGHHVRQFNACIAEAAQDRLEEEGGACMMYAHFAVGFATGGRVEPRFKALVERLAKKNGWFVPAGTLLEHLQAAGGPHVITDRERGQLERKWLFEKLFVGTT